MHPGKIHLFFKKSGQHDYFSLESQGEMGTFQQKSGKHLIIFEYEPCKCLQNSNWTKTLFDSDTPRNYLLAVKTTFRGPGLKPLLHLGFQVQYLT